MLCFHGENSTYQIIIYSKFSDIQLSNITYTYSAFLQNNRKLNIL